MIKFSNMISEKHSLSPSILHKSKLGKAEHVLLKDLLDRNLLKKDNGYDVGTANYMKESPYKFIKAKAISSDQFTINLDGDSVVPINIHGFKDYHLRRDDLLISKDSNVGQAVILDRDLPFCMPCGALYRLPITKNKYYIFAYMKSPQFISQIDEMVPKGATIRHAGKKFLNCKIPFPKKQLNEKIKLVEYVVEMILTRERMIKEKTVEINSLIISELTKEYQQQAVDLIKTKYSEIIRINRLDASFYSPTAKIQKDMLSNYPYGVKTLSELGYRLKRGQNLQVSNIGKSVYSEEKKPNYYTVIKPTNFSDFGTVSSFQYLGNKNELQTLKDGDIVFSAEGTVGKCVLFTKTGEKWITNIHGIVLTNEHKDIVKSSFISCILRFYKSWGYYDNFTVGGQGGSLGKNYWDDIVIPSFKDDLTHKISSLYHRTSENPVIKNKSNHIDHIELSWLESAGVIQLDESKNLLKDELMNIITCISDDIDFDIEDRYNNLINCLK